MQSSFERRVLDSAGGGQTLYTKKNNENPGVTDNCFF